MSNQKQKSRTDVYSIITDRIIAELEKGEIPWRKPWTDDIPSNLVSGKPYRGVNALLLGSLGCKRNLFLTFKQAQELGASIRKGEKSLPVVFWNWAEREDSKTGERKKVAMLRYYSVFNVDQCTGIPEQKIPQQTVREHDPISECEEVIANMQDAPAIRHGGDRAYYHPVQDAIQMPEPEKFTTSGGYYSTLFHELVHSSGHERRLNRKEVTSRIQFGSEEYAIEELTAEIGATFLKSRTGLSTEPIENNAAYIQSWLRRLRNDKRFVVHAGAQAQKAVDYIFNERAIEKDVEPLAEETAEQNQLQELSAIRKRSKEVNQLSR